MSQVLPPSVRCAIRMRSAACAALLASGCAALRDRGVDVAPADMERGDSWAAQGLAALSKTYPGEFGGIAATLARRPGAAADLGATAPPPTGTGPSRITVAGDGFMRPVEDPRDAQRVAAMEAQLRQVNALAGTSAADVERLSRELDSERRRYADELSSKQAREAELLTRLGRMESDLQSHRAEMERLLAEIAGARSRPPSVVVSTPPERGPSTGIGVAAPTPPAIPGPKADANVPDPDQAEDLSRQARALHASGDLAQAEAILLKVLKLREEAFGTDSPRMAGTHNDLGLVYLAGRKYGPSSVHLEKALALYRAKEGENHPYVAAAMNNLGRLRTQQEKPDEALKLYAQAQRVFEKALGRNHPNVATILGNAAAIHQAAGRFGEAEESLERCLKIREKAYSEGHPKVAESLNNLAMLYMEWGKTRPCEDLFLRAARIYEQVYGPGSPDAATVLRNLAALYRREGKEDLALQTARRADGVPEK